jgi:RHS repeat-associated protein
MGTVSYLTIGGEIISETRSGVESDYVPDSLGSTIALLNSSQTITDTWTYWPYGEVQARTGTNSTPFTFVGTMGYFQDLLNNFLYVRARFLRIALTRWQTADPLWPLKPAYAYVGNRPVKMTDASGKDEGSVDCAFGYSCPGAAPGWFSNLLMWCTGTKKAAHFHYCRACGLACIAQCCVSDEDNNDARLRGRLHFKRI